MNRNPLEVIKNNDGDLFENINKTRELAFRDGALPSKEKYLIALALDASLGAADGVMSLARQAINAGATREQIMETLRVVNLICGIGSIYTAARGLMELFETEGKNNI